MLSNIDKYKKDINKLIFSGTILYRKLKNDKNLSQLIQVYEIWYSESQAIIKIILPDRISDFSKMYYDDKTKTGLKIHFQYIPPIRESFEFGDDIPPKRFIIVKSILDSQIGILKSCMKRFESSLFDIKQLLQSDIFNSELDSARELNKKGFVRGAGAIAGVVLEGHLSQVCNNHKIKYQKTDPTIDFLNNLLKSNEVIDIQTWRYIQHLGDLRNLCDHKKKQEPSKDEIDVLIDGVDKTCKTIF